MCGIAGICSAKCSAPIGSIVQNMLHSVSHRGPDGHDVWSDPNGRCAIGHKRLAIIDPEGGHQPLSNEDGTIWITYNGCIYNYQQLAQKLRQKGHNFITNTDTEVIVHAYEEYGTDCLRRFIGMFSFAIWDSNRNILFCARDRLGIKPFYYYNEDGLFIFSSEIKSLLATKLFKKSAFIAALSEYLIFQAPLGKETFFEKIYRLLPGSYLVVDHDGQIVSEKQFWDINFDIDKDHKESYFVDRLRILLGDAVKMRLRSDVPLGAHLSGGLDSSTIVSLASQYYFDDEPIITFTGAFDEGPAYDETEFASLVSKATGAKNLIIRPSASDFIDSLPKIIYFMDEPAAGPGIFPQYMVSSLASKYVKVILGGQGGDEIFGGYARYLIAYLEECLRGAIEETGDIRKHAATLSTIIPSLPMLRNYKPMLEYFWRDGLFESQDSRYYRLMDRSVGIKKIFNQELFDNSEAVREKFSEIFYGSNASAFLNRMLNFDLKVHLPALLHVEDRTTMAWGLESRVPLLDHRIVELMASIPPKIKFKNGQPKHLFRKAVENIVPAKILERKDKMGFPVPLHSWLKEGPVNKFAKEILLDNKAKKRNIFNSKEIEDLITNEKKFSRVIWSALCLELWYDIFIDN